MPRIAVLGGGISGLAAANKILELAQRRGIAVDLTLYERSERLGGCVQTVRTGGLVMETGADSVLIDKPAGAALLQRLGLEQRIVDVQPQFKGARIVHAGRLHRIPSHFRLFAPTSLPALLRSGIFSAKGIARAAMEPFVRARQSNDDESLASFVTRRFGREVLDRLAQPLIGGIYSADPRRLSMNATLPQFVQLERQYGSILRGMRTQRAKPTPRLVSLREGLGAIVDALSATLGDAVRTGAEAIALERDAEGWAIAFADSRRAHADAIVFALPAYASGTLLRRYDGRLGELLGGIRYNSIATVTLAYASDAARLLPSSTGFIVPFVEGRAITAATFSSQKYPGRAPAGISLLRAFAGGALQPDLLDLDDEELIRATRGEFSKFMRLGDDPQHCLVTRWVRFLPEYAAGHLEVIHEAQRRIARFPGLALAGSAYHGVGIPDCIKSGETAAESVFGYIRD